THPGSFRRRRHWTATLCDRLNDRDESPWKDMRAGKGINDRLLASFLKPYGIKSAQVRIGEINRQGYLADAFADAWGRYCPSSSDEPYKPYNFDNETNFVGDVGDVGDGEAKHDAAVAFEERAAIREYNGGLDRAEAEAAAAEELGLPEERAPDSCPHC